MAIIQGVVVFARFDKADTFSWTDPTTGQVKPIRSLKVLLPHGDGTVTRESLTLPPDMEIPRLTKDETYGFRCSVTINKKQQRLSWTLIPGSFPLPALEID